MGRAIRIRARRRDQGIGIATPRAAKSADAIGIARQHTQGGHDEASQEHARDAIDRRRLRCGGLQQHALGQRAVGRPAGVHLQPVRAGHG